MLTSGTSTIGVFPRYPRLQTVEAIRQRQPPARTRHPQRAAPSPAAQSGTRKWPLVINGHVSVVSVQVNENTSVGPGRHVAPDCPGIAQSVLGGERSFSGKEQRRCRVDGNIVAKRVMVIGDRRAEAISAEGRAKSVAATRSVCLRVRRWPRRIW